MYLFVYNCNKHLFYVGNKNVNCTNRVCCICFNDLGKVKI